MKISYDWVKEYIKTEKSAEEVGKLLTQSGLEVEGIERFDSIPGGLEGVVIGEVLTCEQHPNADKLSCTTIDIGTGEPSPIVCGAPNIAAGQKVVVATVGTTLYPQGHDSFKIKKAKIRGEVSLGMVCAEDELGLGKSHDGIIVLDTDLPNGSPAAKYFNIIQDDIIEIGLTPNRADGFSHFGVARDLKVLLKQDLISKEITPSLFSENEPNISIKIENTDKCPRYSGVELSGITVKESPGWLKNRLRSIGLEPINNIVDVTNFILHDLGQPLHAFDADKIKGNQVIVKELAEGTPFITLDDVERKLKSTDLMICDAKEPMCIGGVFGGLHSGVSEMTQNIFLESAYFSPDTVRKSAQAHVLKTDASFRFERGTDPNNTVYALQRAAQLIIEVAGGKVSSKVQDLYPEKVIDFQFSVNVDRIVNLIGLDITYPQIREILVGLEIQILTERDADWELSVPPYRVDVQREADIAEEVLRIIGYDQVTLSTDLESKFLAKDNAKTENQKDTICAFLAANGFNEILTNSLTNSKYYKGVNDVVEEESVVVLNRLSEDLDIMRQSLVYSGLEVIVHNVNRRQKDLKLFEFGKVYKKSEGEYKEETRLTLFVTGAQNEESWQKKTSEVHFHDLSERCFTILKKLKIEGYTLKSYKSSIIADGLEIIASNGSKIGEVGLVSQSEMKKVGAKMPVLFADLYLDKIHNLKRKQLKFSEISKFPEVRRDLSLVLDRNITFEQVKEVSFKVERNILKGINVFDVYEGEHVGEGKKSYSVSFSLQDQKQTLKDKVIDKIMNKLIQAYERELGAVIRK